MNTEAPKKVRAVYMLDPDIRKAIRMDAARNERDMSDVANELLRKALKLPTSKQSA